MRSCPLHQSFGWRKYGILEYTFLILLYRHWLDYTWILWLTFTAVGNEKKYFGIQVTFWTNHHLPDSCNILGSIEWITAILRETAECREYSGSPTRVRESYRRTTGLQEDSRQSPTAIHSNDPSGHLGIYFLKFDTTKVLKVKNFRNQFLIKNIEV